MLNSVAQFLRLATMPALAVPFSMLPGEMEFPVRNFTNDGRTVEFQVCLTVPGSPELDLMDVMLNGARASDSDALQGLGMANILPTPMHIIHLCAVGRGLCDGKDFFPAPVRVTFVPANANICQLLTTTWAPELALPIPVAALPPPMLKALLTPPPAPLGEVVHVA